MAKKKTTKKVEKKLLFTGKSLLGDVLPLAMPDICDVGEERIKKLAKLTIEEAVANFNQFRRDISNSYDFREARPKEMLVSLEDVQDVVDDYDGVKLPELTVMEVLESLSWRVEETLNDYKDWLKRDEEDFWVDHGGLKNKERLQKLGLI